MELLYKNDADQNAWKYYQKIYRDKIEIDLDTVLKNTGIRLSGIFALNGNKLFQVDNKYKGKIMIDLEMRLRLKGSRRHSSKLLSL